MPYIQPEMVEKAREMDLLTYLKSYEPQELVHLIVSRIFRKLETAVQ